MGSWIFDPVGRLFINLSFVVSIDENSAEGKTFLYYRDYTRGVITDPATRVLIHEYLSQNMVRQ